MLNGETGEKYRQRLTQIWDPLFSKSKGGKIDFQKLLEQAKFVGISDKAMKLFGEFRDEYD